MAVFMAGAQNPFTGSLRLSDAFSLARQQGKLVFIQYESEGCAECNDVANKGLSDPALAARLASTFICLRMTAKHPDRALVTQRYHLALKMGSLFLDQSGNLVHSFLKTTTSAADLNTQIDLALFKAGESLQLGTLEKEYANNNRSPGLMEAYILKRKELGMSTDSLLDEYASGLSPDSLKSARTLQFIASMAPLLGSTADELFRHDQLRFNNAWYGLPMQQRVAINTTIITKSRKKAVEDKNEAYALQIATFAQSTYVSNAGTALRAFENTMMEYYRETGDTGKYFPVAMSYYDHYFMPVDVDSVRRSDSLRLAQLLPTARSRDTTVNGRTMKVTQKVRFAPTAQNYTRELTKAAQSFYEGTTDPSQLAAATRWIVKGLEFYQTPEALDTYARLLYVQKQTALAINTEQKAIDLKKKQGYPAADLEAVLQKMKNGNLMQETAEH